MEIVIMEFLKIAKDLKSSINEEINKRMESRQDYDMDMTDISVINEEIKRLQEMIKYNQFGCMFEWLYYEHYVENFEKFNDEKYKNDFSEFEPRFLID